jgi:hypothetical protein
MGMRKDAGARKTRVGDCIRTPERRMHKNTEARNSRRCSCYPRNATIGACSGLSKGGRAIHGMRLQEHVVNWH